MQLTQILENKEKKKIYLLLVLMLIGTVLEILGVGIVIPALGVITIKDVGETYPELVPWLEIIGSPNQKQLVIIGMSALATVYLAKGLFLVFLIWMQTKFIFGLQASLSQRLFSGYLKQPFIFHLQRNSAQLIRNATSEVYQFANVVQAVMQGITEFLVLFGISVLLLIAEPTGATIVVVILTLFASGFYWLTRGKILGWGEKRQYHEGLRIQHIQQGLGAAKEIKLLGREDNFALQYSNHNYGTVHVLQRQAFIQQIPRISLELIAVIVLATLVIIVVIQSKAIETFIPTLGLFAAAAFRLMPSANRLIASIQQIRYGFPAIDTLNKELKLIGEDIERTEVISVKKQQFNGNIVLKGVDYNYPNTKQKTLYDINIEIKYGTSVGIIGESGAGKSTLVDIILGVLVQKNGKVLVGSIDTQSNIRGWQDQIGYVPQTIFLTDDTLKKNIAIGLADSEINEKAILNAVNAAQLTQFVNSLPNGLDTFVGERGVRLSGGQRQRIGIARALYHDPSVLVLDESTSALDNDTEKDVMEAITALHGKKTIIIVAHRFTTVAHCDKLFKLENGKVIAEGKVSELLV